MACFRVKGSIYANPAASRDYGLHRRTAQQQFRFLDDSLIENSMSHSDFSFDDLINPDFRVVIFLVLPFHLIDSYNRWL